MFKKLKAFTLAEALIVITIIGVIAVVALPILKKNYETKAFHSAMKKNYYVLKTALDKYRAENFTPIKGTDYGYDVRAKLEPYLNFNVRCSGAGGVYISPCPTDSYLNYKDKKISFGKALSHYGGLILNDGTALTVGHSPNTSLIDFSKYIYVDVNGYNKLPNKLGVDLYVFQLNGDGELLPMGAQGTEFEGTELCSESSTNVHNGYACANKVFMEER